MKQINMEGVTVTLPEQSGPRRLFPAGPMSRIAALKWIGVGAVCCLVAVAFLVAGAFVGMVPIVITGCFLLWGPMFIYYGMVTLTLPARFLGSKLHNRINYAGIIGLHVALIAGAALSWRYWWPLLTGH